MGKTKDVVKKMEDWYIDLSERAGTVLFRKFLQALNTSPDGNVSLSMGQVIDAFVFGPYDHIAKKRIEATMDSLNRRIKKIEVDNEQFTKNIEEYSILVYRVYSAAGLQQYEDLRNSYINQLIYFLDIHYSDEQNKIFYQQLLFRFTIDHLHILLFAETYLTADRGTRFERSKTLRDNIISEFSSKGLNKPLI